MQEILFDSRLELDRLPVGAAAEGTPLRIGLRVLSSLGVNAMRVIIRNDDTGEDSISTLEKVWSEGGYDRYEATVEAASPGLYWYWFSADTPDGEKPIGRFGRGADFSSYDPVPWQLTVYSPAYSTPDWIKGGVFYHIFVDRFYRSGETPLRKGSVPRNDWGAVPVYQPDENGIVRNNDFFGGNLRGIIEKLPYLHELGVTCIYFSPIFEAASNHKYDTSDYMRVDPSFGDEGTLFELCGKALSMGIKIICDGVFNHTGDDSVYFDRYGNYGGNGAYNSKFSPYYTWYSFSNWPDEYEAWWGIKTLPQVREDNPDFRNFIFGENGVLRHWMRTGVSGWRLDVADELPEPFLRELRKTVKDENPESLIIGEVWEDATTKVSYGYRRHYFDGSELDSVMNYPFKNAIIDYILSGNAHALRETVESICENYPKPALDCLMNGLGTHDTPRILTVLGGKSYESRSERANAALDVESRKTAIRRLFAAALLQCTLPGVPCIYYGDEAGLEGYEDPFNRRCFPWGHEDDEILNWYKKLIAARRSSPAFDGGEYRSLFSENGVFAFLRKKHGAQAVSVINMGGERFSYQTEKTAVMLAADRAFFENGLLTVEPGGCALLGNTGPHY